MQPTTLLLSTLATLTLHIEGTNAAEAVAWATGGDATQALYVTGGCINMVDTMDQQRCTTGNARCRWYR